MENWWTLAEHGDAVVALAEEGARLGGQDGAEAAHGVGVGVGAARRRWRRRRRHRRRRRRPVVVAARRHADVTKNKTKKMKWNENVSLDSTIF